MNDLVLGVIVFVVVSAFVSLFLLSALRRARQGGLTGRALLERLLPFFLADLALVALFALWVLTNT